MDHPQLAILYRGKRISIPLDPEKTVLDVKASLVAVAKSLPVESFVDVSPDDLKLLFKGKVLVNEANIKELLLTASSPSKQTYNLVATGISSAERHSLQSNDDVLRRNAERLVKDDLSDVGKVRQQQRAAAGRLVLKQHQQKASNSGESSQYRFGGIETLPGLPNEAEARRILETLSNDVGILACMAKHKWRVGVLAELYPKGNVGESPVCIMGLNQNNGAKILLRLRTDDLNGFRKPLSIRKVLYHELAHNVFSDHDDNFFRLMRQIERECLELDWTQGHGMTGASDSSELAVSYTAGSYRLGGEINADSLPRHHKRELAAQAAECRMSPEEEEIMQNCGCQSLPSDLFLPKRTQ